MNGKVTSELWKYDTGVRSWSLPNVTSQHPIGVMGHAAVEIDGFMYVFMGYSDKYSYVKYVQKMDLGSKGITIELII